jgi:hypothetical protein
MSSTSDAAAAAAALVEMEVWGVTLMRYLSVMGMVVVHYDLLLTLDEEVCLTFLHLLFTHLTVCSQMRLVWPGALSWPKTLYYINRYVSVFVMIYSNYRQ